MKFMRSSSFVIGAAIIVAGVVATAQQSSPVGARTTTARSGAQPKSATGAKLLPGSRPNTFSTIRGTAAGPSNAALPHNLVRLRDVRFGRVVDTQTTDNAGAFTFANLDPGSYVVEVLGNDQRVLAASQIIHVEAADMVNAVVRLPFRAPPLAGVMGNSASTAAAVTAEAAAAGVLATTVAGAPVSRQTF